MGTTDGPRKVGSAYWLILGIGLVALALNGLLGPADGLPGTLISDVVYLGLFVVAAVSCGVRARHAQARTAWVLATVGLTLWLAAEVVYRAVEPAPSAFYPAATELLLGCAFALAYGTLVLLARERLWAFDPMLALDGAIAGLTVAAVVAVWLIPGGDAAGGTPGAGQLLASLGGLWFVIAVLGVTGWRPGWAWGLITLGIAVNVLGQVVLVQLLDAGQWRRGTLADPLFVFGALMLGAAARLPMRTGDRALEGPRRLPVPVGCGTAALALLLISALGSVGVAATLLAAFALALTLVRMVVALELLERSQSEARTDPLTGLGNRRRLLGELDSRTRGGMPAAPFTLALFDLDGFKAYNDRFGHLGGDALLERIAGRLGDAVRPGRAFRMGGDEFCAVIDGTPVDARAALSRARVALTERGDGFLITASCGAVHCPDEARTTTDALRLADTRMYADKEVADRPGSRPPDRGSGLGRLPAREDDPLRDVGSLAQEIAGRLGLDRDEARRIGQAAELRDIGKIAVPDEILGKPGALLPDELRLVRQHSVIGERILRVAPALADLAPLVRASHERWDGSGYPDGVRGEAIPFGARIVAACDAYHAMVHRAPHREARSPDEALRELRRHAGSQFDPRVVAAFGVVVRDRMRATRRQVRASH